MRCVGISGVVHPRANETIHEMGMKIDHQGYEKPWMTILVVITITDKFSNK